MAVLSVGIFAAQAAICFYHFLVYFIELIVADTVGELLNVKIGYIVKINRMNTNLLSNNPKRSVGSVQIGAM